jgi:Sugar phosphate isomerases/epimerases
MQSTRRRFIKSGLGCAAAITLNPIFPMTAAEHKKIPIGFQLYTVRGEFSRNVPETLKQLAQIGYKAVEFWGYAGTPAVYQKYTASELRKFLDENGLKCCGMHLDLKALEKDNLQRTIDNNRVLGNKYLNVAAAEEKMKSEKGIGELAQFLNGTAVECRPHHMLVGYHAHPFDFQTIDGRSAWEILFTHLDPQLNMQMDVGNTLVGKGDPIGMLKKFPGRTHSIHIKEYEDKTFDSDYYMEVFHLCETTSKTEWYIVEMGGAEGNGFDIPRQALEKLHRLGK